jgi:hypothetical protein
MNGVHPHDVFFEGLCLLVERSAPHVRAVDVAKATGWPFVMAAAEEWLDGTTLILHPAMRATDMHGLFALRSRLLSRLTCYGLRTIYLWMSAHNQLEPADVLPDTLIVGSTLAPIAFVSDFDDAQVCFRSLQGETLCLEWAQTSNGSGLEAISVLASDQVTEQLAVITQIDQAYRLLSQTPSVSFVTSLHPIREWQTWHFGVDSLEVIAMCADTAAPLALMADVVARTVAVYHARWRMAGQLIAEWADSYAQLAPACGHVDNACFFMEIVQKYYPLEIPRRALTVAEGAMVAAAFRDARQEWRAVAMLLHDVLQSQQ